MNIDSISSGAVIMNTKQKTGDAASTAVASKALDIQAQSAAQLTSSASKPASSESHLGSKFDGFA